MGSGSNYRKKRKKGEKREKGKNNLTEKSCLPQSSIINVFFKKYEAWMCMQKKMVMDVKMMTKMMVVSQGVGK